MRIRNGRYVKEMCDFKYYELGLCVQYIRLISDLVVRASDFGTSGPGSIPGWAPIIHTFAVQTK